MPRFRVPTDAGVFEIETDVDDPTEEELLALVARQSEAAPVKPEAEEEGPGLVRRGAALAARLGGPIVGGAAGFAVGGPVGAAAGAGVGGAAGEALAETLLGEDLSATEIGLSAGLSAIPAGPFARAAAKPGLALAKRVALHAAEGATQGALAAEAESVVKEGQLAGIRQVAGGALAGAAVGGVAGRFLPGSAEPGAPKPPNAVAAEVAAESEIERQGSLFARVPGMAGEIPPTSPAPDSRMTELKESVDRLFPHLGEVERLGIKDAVDRDSDTILQHTRWAQSLERTDALAEELVMDLSKRLPPGTVLNPEQTRHAIRILGPMQEKVTALAGEVAARPEDDTLKLKLQQATSRLSNLIYSYAGARAEAGRTLNIYRYQSKALESGDMKAILTARKLGIDADEIAKVIAASPNDPVSQYKMIRDMYKPNWKDKLKWYYYTNILSGPQTHIRNLVSNTVNLSLRPLTTPFAAAADVATSALTGKEREVFLGETPQAFLQMFRAMPEAWNKMSFMFKNGFSQTDLSDFEVRPAEMPGGIATNLVGRGLAAADEFFRTLGFNMEMHSGAYARARKQALKEGLKGGELVDRTSALTAQLLDEKPRDLLEQADRFARRVTFQEDDNELAQALIRVRDKVNIRGVPIGDFILPFVRTPANIFRQGVRFSPAGLLAKKAPGREGAQQVGEAVLGSTLLLPVAWLAATGHITGSAPTDAGERDAFYAEGKRPNSIFIPTVGWVSYTELGPLVLPFAVIANAADAWRRGDKEINEETVGALAAQIGRTTLEQSYLTGLSAVFQALEDPERYGKAFVQNLAAGFVPLVGLQRNIARATDPNVREASGFVEGLQRNVPGASKELMPKLDALGQPATRPSGAGALVTPVVSPAKVDPLRQELARIGVQPDPLRKAKDITIGDQKVKLDARSDFAIRAATGALRQAMLRELFADEDYKGATREEQRKAVSSTLRQAGAAAKAGARALIQAGEPVTFEALTEGMNE